MNAIADIYYRMRAKFPFIWAVTHEEGRFIGSLRAVIKELDQDAGFERTTFTWSLTDGLIEHVAGDKVTMVQDTNDLIPALDHVKKLAEKHAASKAADDLLKRNPEEEVDEIARKARDKKAAAPQTVAERILFIMKDPHPFMEIPVVRRLIRDLAEVMPQTYGMTVVFVSPELALPADIEKCVSLVDFPLPEEAEMKTLATSLVYNRQNQKKLGRRLTDEEVTAIARACLGLTLDEAENVIAKGIAQPDGTDSGALIQGINGEKKEMLRKAGLEYQEPDITLKDLAGMEVLKDHFARDKKVMMSPKAEELCLEKPKGVLLFGPPGTAKTRFSVAVAGELAQPLVILDLNAMKGSLVGQTETTLRTALARIDAIGHCVVQLDEIEKMFAGSMGASMDSGVSQGILGKMLSWLTSPKRKAYVIMTANRLFDREMSPTVAPEMIRKGRIDEHFFVDLPTADVRAAIFQIHIAKRKRKPRDFDLTKLAEKTEGFSGSEIEQVVSQGIRDAFFENHDLRTEDMVSAAVGTNPLSVTMKEEIERIRNWVVKEKRARSASKPQDAKRRVVTSGTRELL